MSGEGQIVEADGGGQKQAASAATHSPVVENAPLHHTMVKHLRRWADARERRNTPGGHGRTGTHLLNTAAEYIEVLERSLIECATVSGADVSGGVPTYPPLAEWAVREVRQLREDYDEALNSRHSSAVPPKGSDHLGEQTNE